MVTLRTYRARERLVTVSCSDGVEVHLAWRSDSQLAPRTLCGAPPETAQAAGAFLDLGCTDCAELAADLGLYVATDDDGAAVSLRAFLQRHAR